MCNRVSFARHVVFSLLGSTNRNLLTTIMAILPPTSPTTVIGGFSFGITTVMGKQNNFREQEPGRARPSDAHMPFHVVFVDAISFIIFWLRKHIA